MSDGNITRRDVFIGAAAVAGASLLPQSLAAQQIPAEKPAGLSSLREQLFDADWRFHVGDVPGAETANFDDTSWRKLDVPHDWSIEDLPPRHTEENAAAIWSAGETASRVGPFDRQLSPGQTATGYVLGGTGWYRKHFSISHLPADRHFEIRFDGVYMDSDVWLNGQHLGNHPYGYTSFAYDLTPHLSRDANNVIAVRVRNEGKNSRWYSGSGIFRHVWLTVTHDVHIPLWGVYVNTPQVSAASAKVNVSTKVENLSNGLQNPTVRVRILDNDGTEVAKQEHEQRLGAAQTASVHTTFDLQSPALWSHETPNLYRAEVSILLNNSETDRTTVNFGIREIEVDPEQGLRINSQEVKLKGGCLHHDNGILGSACIDRAEERRVELMKTNGFNAIRTSHNPPSPAFLDACDRLGMYVIDEAFDMWQDPKNPDDYHRFFDEWWQRDLSSMVLRDRNHPSVIFWSIGNEIHERAEPKGVTTAESLVNGVKILDDTRPLTMAVCHFWDWPNREWKQTDPAFSNLDVGGYNYQWQEYEHDHARLPKRIMMGTESFPLEAFENWQAVEQHSYVLGDFVWTGMDYLGETGIGHSVLEGDPDSFNAIYPWFNAYCGDIDLIGDKKPQMYFRDVVWGKSKLELAVQRPLPPNRKEKISRWGWSDELRSWTWPGFEGQPMNVRVYSSAEQVRLLLNGKEIETKPVSRETKLRAEFTVPYQPGELRAVALKNGNEVESRTFRTAGKSARLGLSADRSQIRADRNDLAYVTVSVLDAAGNLVPDAILPVNFAIQGAGQLAGVGNANPKDAASFQQPRRHTFHGKCLAILRPLGKPGVINLRATAQGLAPASITVKAG